jgi:hypothetical protein
MFECPYPGPVGDDAMEKTTWAVPTLKRSKISETKTNERQQNHILIDVFSMVIPKAKRRQMSVRILW